MLVSKRQQEILELLEQKGHVYVSNLSKQFQVTKETIRRDLEALEKQGLIHRTHGGAVMNQREKEVSPLIQREVAHLEAKREIAREAAKGIQDGDIIALDSSDVSFQLARLLGEREITVITNSIAVTLEFLRQDKVKVITVGGYLNKDSTSFFGTMTEKSIEGYHVDKFYFSCHGVHLEHGIYENNEMEAQVKQKFISISDRLILLADHTKFGQKSLTNLLSLDKVDQIITDHGLPLNQLSAFKVEGLNIQLAQS
jgi:DeoR/GlpR family transcriptional regulator of sugar metabolism